MATAQVRPEDEVQFNVYGYSAAISGMKIRLRGIARDYSICYCVDKDTILAAAKSTDRDFEYYH